MDQVRARTGDTLDALIWRERGLGPDDLPAVLAANPGLASLGPVLPIGTTVLIPDAPPANRQRDVVQLWT
ncbi:tail protein X [Sphingomonas zeae]